MKKYRYYIECASGVYNGVLVAADHADAEKKLQAAFRRNHPTESMWVWFVTEA